jgi:hypothetical protein
MEYFMFSFCVYYIQLGTLYFFQGEDLGKSEYLERPGAIVSNHVSHLDILYHMSSSLPSFVAKVLQLCCIVDIIHPISQKLCPQNVLILTCLFLHMMTILLEEISSQIALSWSYKVIAFSSCVWSHVLF